MAMCLGVCIYKLQKTSGTDSDPIPYTSIIDMLPYLYTTLFFGVLMIIAAAWSAVEEDKSSTKDDSAYYLRVACALVASTFVACRLFHLFMVRKGTINHQPWQDRLWLLGLIIIRGNEVLPLVCLGLACWSVCPLHLFSDPLRTW